ncbi:hypothetical protein V6N11_072228 [Hibiscus sabdariffa]|uniref:Peroxiredoxin Q, chloroplastic n=1 Tax=Hibiscus sabdariffa TaxID=183260 RepID=A0ABR2U2P7_9ROSI
MASSLGLPTHTVASLLPSQTPKTHSSAFKCVPILSKSSHSQFYGLKFSHSSSLSIPSSSSFKTSISAKVNKGSVPPSFTLKDQDGKNVSLSKFKGKPVVVYFYPADESPSCTKQACAFRDSYEKFKKAGAEVIGISVDNTASHKSFAQKYRLPFTLLSDEDNKVRKEWGVPADLFGVLPGRQTYVLDKKGSSYPVVLAMADHPIICVLGINLQILFSSLSSLLRSLLPQSTVQGLHAIFLFWLCQHPMGLSPGCCQSKPLLCSERVKERVKQLGASDYDWGRARGNKQH